MPLRRPMRTGLLLLIAGVALAAIAVVVWFTAGGFQTGAYGGLTEQQRDEQDRAAELAFWPLAAGGVLVVAAAACVVVALLRRNRRPSPR